MNLAYLHTDKIKKYGFQALLLNSDAKFQLSLALLIEVQSYFGIDAAYWKLLLLLA